MSNRSAKLFAATFASILAGASFTFVTEVRAQAAAAAADNCLTAPKDKTPVGSHWHYRLERGTKRQCWYLRGEDDKSARAAPQEASADEAPESAATDRAPAPSRPAVRKSVANAHAELTAARARAEPEPAAVAEPRTVGMAPAIAFPNGPAAIAPDTTTPSSTVGTRWPDTSAMGPSGTSRTAAAEPQATPPEVNEAATPPAPVAVAAVDPVLARQSASMQMLFLVMAGALALAGITASLIYRFGRARARKHNLKIRRERRAMWDRIHSERPSPSMLPDEEVSIWRRDEPRDPRAPDDPQRRATEMLARLARSAQH